MKKKLIKSKKVKIIDYYNSYFIKKLDKLKGDNMKKKIINYFFDDEEYEIFKPYLNLMGKIAIISAILTIIIRIAL